jgi:hypothetical protein
VRYANAQIMARATTESKVTIVNADTENAVVFHMALYGAIDPEGASPAVNAGDTPNEKHIGGSST